MRQDTSARRPSLFDHLFAERQVYLRSGLESSYVVLSRRLQIGAALAMLLVVGGLVFASYSSITKHLEAAEQSREIARLEGVTQSLTAAANVSEAPPDESLAELQASLSEADAERTRLEELARTATAEAREVQRELALAEERLVALEEELETATTERDSLAGKLAAETGAEPAGPDQVGELRGELEETARRVEELSGERRRLGGELETAAAEIARLEQSLAAAEEAAGDATSDLQQALARAEGENARLRQELEALGEERAALTAQLEAETLPAGGTAAEPAELQRLQTDLAEANARIAELDASRAAAETEVARLQQEAASAAQTALATTGELDLQVAALKLEEDGFTAIPGSPAFLVGAEQTVAALDADLAAAESTLEASADFAAVEAPFAAARARIATLEASIAAIKARDAAMQAAFTTLSPLPPPPNPRR